MHATKRLTSEHETKLIPTSNTDLHTRQPELSRAQSRSLGWRFFLRVCLSAIAVVICYQFQWTWLRKITADLNLGLDSLLGVHWTRTAIDQAWYNGKLYRYTIACTMADCWCGALPLVWGLQRKMRENVAYIAALTCAMFALNILRLSASDLLFSRGVSWTLAHDGTAALAYLVIWYAIRTREAWRVRPAHDQSCANPAGTHDREPSPRTALPSF